MPFQAEIVRGVRVAAITFTLLLCGIVGYRISSASAPDAEEAKPEVVRLKAKRLPATAEAKPPAETPTSSTAVPAAPPIRRIVKRRAAAPPVQAAVKTPPAINQTAVSLAPESKPAAEQSPI